MIRRHFLFAAQAVAATLWLPRSAWAQPRLQSDPFALGVASGAPTADSVVLWTRLVADSLVLSGVGTAGVTVRWELAQDAQFKQIVQTGQHTALPLLAHSVHVEVPNLQADRWYFYRFMLGDAVSATGRTRTLPAPDALANRLRIAYASCQRWEHGYFSAYTHMLQEDVDFVMFLGDYIYEYPNASNAVRKPTGGWVVSLDDYRKRYALHKSEPELQAMHAACPWLMSWDDHEVQNDYSGTSEGNGGPIVDFVARRMAAYQAYYEHMPLRASTLTRAFSGLGTGAELRIYQQMQFGRLAQITLLDTRQYKSPLACTEGGVAGSSTLDPAQCAIWNDPARTMLGESQEAWFAKTALQSQGPWNICGQSSLVGQRDFKTGATRRGQTLWNDGWDGYGPARSRLIDAMAQNKQSMPVMLGGDVHANWVGHVKADYSNPASANIGVEFCGTSITARSNPSDKLAEQLVRNPHFVFADDVRKGYGIAQFTPKHLTTSLRVVSDVAQRATTVSTLAKFVVQAGQPLVQRADS
jgi:alkaline phosphatase D